MKPEKKAIKKIRKIIKEKREIIEYIRGLMKKEIEHSVRYNGYQRLEYEKLSEIWGLKQSMEIIRKEFENDKAN